MSSWRGRPNHHLTPLVLEGAKGTHPPHPLFSPVRACQQLAPASLAPFVPFYKPCPGPRPQWKSDREKDAGRAADPSTLIQGPGGVIQEGRHQRRCVNLRKPRNLKSIFIMDPSWVTFWFYPTMSINNTTDNYPQSSGLPT